MRVRGRGLLLTTLAGLSLAAAPAGALTVIVETGRYDDLMAHNDAFAALARRQVV